MNKYIFCVLIIFCCLSVEGNEYYRFKLINLINNSLEHNPDKACRLFFWQQTDDIYIKNEEWIVIEKGQKEELNRFKVCELWNNTIGSCITLSPSFFSRAEEYRRFKEQGSKGYIDPFNGGIAKVEKDGSAEFHTSIRAEDAYEIARMLHKDNLPIPTVYKTVNQRLPGFPKSRQPSAQYTNRQTQAYRYNPYQRRK